MSTAKRRSILTVHVMAKRCARVFVMRETQTDRAPAKYGHFKRETGPV
jgi:hypothetical protein